MQICFFNDQKVSNFLPLTLTRPLDDLRTGIFTISEKWAFFLKEAFVSRILDPQLEGVFEKGNINPGQDCLWINSRVLPDYSLIKNVAALETGSALYDVTGETVIAAKVEGKRSSAMHQNNTFDAADLAKKEYGSKFSAVCYLWDLLALNGQEIQKDLQHLRLKTLPESKYGGFCISLNAEHIFVADSAKIEPGCILIAEKGPIYIGPEAVIEAGAILRGPVAICKGATVKASARISDGTTIGPVSKAGGEIANTIFHSYSNKAHDGFVGNSLIGQWVNFGADTNTSNLKNNYSPVTLSRWDTREPFETGVQFFGSVIADHSKTAINTMLNTGTVCGVSSNIFQAGFPPKYIPSFSWMDGTETQVYKLDKALEAMRAMMKRRGVELTDGYIIMMTTIFEKQQPA